MRERISLHPTPYTLHPSLTAAGLCRNSTGFPRISAASRHAALRQTIGLGFHYSGIRRACQAAPRFTAIFITARRSRIGRERNWRRADRPPGRAASAFFSRPPGCGGLFPHCPTIPQSQRGNMGPCAYRVRGRLRRPRACCPGNSKQGNKYLAVAQRRLGSGVMGGHGSGRHSGD